MSFSHTIGNTRYTFAHLRELLAKATPLRSGDQLAGVAAESAEERVAAQFALADLPIKHFLAEQIVPYESDEVTRLIVDSHDRKGLRTGAIFHRGRTARLASLRRCDRRAVGGNCSRPHAGNGRGGQQTDAGSGSDRRRRKDPRGHALSNHGWFVGPT